MSFIVLYQIGLCILNLDELCKCVGPSHAVYIEPALLVIVIYLQLTWCKIRFCPLNQNKPKKQFVFFFLHR